VKINTTVPGIVMRYANKLHGFRRYGRKQMKRQLQRQLVFYTAWVNAGKPDLSNLDAKLLQLVIVNY
jgi:hypothetical protein